MLHVDENIENHLSLNEVFIRFFVRWKVEKFFEDDDISNTLKKDFYKACMEFHKAAFVYAVKIFPLIDPLLSLLTYLTKSALLKYVLS